MEQFFLKTKASSAHVEDPLMTIAEVAGYCKVSTSTVKKWVREKQLPCIRVTADARIRRSDINAFIVRHRSDTTATWGKG